ncbi:hypothetical protein D9M72_559510 [compost metagenome]
MTILTIGFEIGLLDLVTDELGIARCQLRPDEIEIIRFSLLGKLLPSDSLFQDVHQMNRIRRDFLGVVVKGLRQHLEGKAGADAVHALIDARGIAIFLQGLRLGIGIFQVLAVIDPHLRVGRRVLV